MTISPFAPKRRILRRPPAFASRQRRGRGLGTCLLLGLLFQDSRSSRSSAGFVDNRLFRLPALVLACDGGLCAAVLFCCREFRDNSPDRPAPVDKVQVVPERSTGFRGQKKIALRGDSWFPSGIGLTELALSHQDSNRVGVTLRSPLIVMRKGRRGGAAAQEVSVGDTRLLVDGAGSGSSEWKSVLAAGVGRRTVRQTVAPAGPYQGD